MKEASSLDCRGVGFGSCIGRRKIRGGFGVCDAGADAHRCAGGLGLRQRKTGYHRGAIRFQSIRGMSVRGVETSECGIVWFLGKAEVLMETPPQTSSAKTFMCQDERLCSCRNTD